MTHEIRLMRDEDLGAVEALYAKVFDQRALEYWRRRREWQFKRSPATSLRPARMWVAVRGEEVFGFLASFPARLKVLDTEICALCPCDLMVSPEARGAGLGERLIRAYIEEADGLAIALAYSPTSGRMFTRLGYHWVFAEPTILRPLRGGRLMRSKVRGRSAGPALRHKVLRLFAPILGLGAEGAVALVNAVRSPKASRDLRVEVDPPFGPDFDLLWREASREIPVMFARDARTLQWRFKEDPITHHTVFAAREPSGTLAGYAVVCESMQHNLRVGKVMDLFCPPSRAKEVVGLLSASFLRHFRRAGADLVTTKGLHPGIRGPLRRMMYLKPPGKEAPAQFLMRPGDPLAEAVYDADKWHLSHSDGDEDFVP
jgi:GNAT superfamily N-acetyltransferase